MKRLADNAMADGGSLPQQKGFSLVELLIAMAVFLVVSIAAFTLFSKQQFASQVLQGQVGLNLALRSAATQLQMDLANAGSYYYQNVNVPSWPVGVTIVNNVVAAGSSCYNSTTQTYGASCFDQINIIAAANPTTYPAINVTNHLGGTTTAYCSNTRTGDNTPQAVAGTAFGQAASGFTLAQTAAEFNKGDQLLFVTAGGNYMTSVVLTQNASVVGSAVQFTFNPTLTEQALYPPPPAQGGVMTTFLGYNSVANDPLGITTCNGDSLCPPAAQPTSGQVINGLGEQYCGGDWIIKLAPITYQVDTTTNPSDPTLTRTVGNGTPVPVMDQVLGFKIGAAIWNSPTGSGTDGTDTDISSCPSGTGICPYQYVAANYMIASQGDQAYNFTLVRAVRVSLIGRTVPNYNATYQFRNSFDGGPYQVQGTAVVVSPRDLSMDDN